METFLKSLFHLVAIFIFFPLCNLTNLSIANDQNSNIVSINWPEIIIQLCFASAMEMSLLRVQVEDPQLPLTLRLVSVTNFFAFVFVLLANFVARRHPDEADVLEKAAIFFFVTTFFLSVTIPLPLCVKCIAFSMYVGSSVALILDNCSPPLPTCTNWIEARRGDAKYGPPPS